MADAKKYYYMRLNEAYFESDEQVLLEAMPDGYLYSNILLKLYLKSLKRDGLLMFNDRIPYNAQMIAQITRHQVGTVEKALDIFQQLGIVEIMDSGAIYMLDVQNFVGKTTTEADRIRAYRARIETEKKALEASRTNVQDVPYICTPEKEIEIEKKLERKKKREIDAPSAPASGKSPRHKYGQYENVLLSDEDMGKLKAEFPADWEQRIERLSEYMASKGTKYKNHLATIRAWAKKDKDKEAKAGGTNGGTAGGYAEGDPRLGTWI